MERRDSSLTLTCLNSIDLVIVQQSYGAVHSGGVAVKWVNLLNRFGFYLTFIWLYRSGSYPHVEFLQIRFIELFTE